MNHRIAHFIGLPWHFLEWKKVKNLGSYSKIKVWTTKKNTPCINIIFWCQNLINHFICAAIYFIETGGSWCIFTVILGIQELYFSTSFLELKLHPKMIDQFWPKNYESIFLPCVLKYFFIYFTFLKKHTKSIN